MKTFRIIGIDQAHYENIKYDTYIDWVMNNTTTALERQLCLSDKALQNYFMNQLSSIEIRFVAHLQMFKKPLNGQERLDLYFDYLKRFNCFFPQALKPKLKAKQKIYEPQFN